MNPNSHLSFVAGDVGVLGHVIGPIQFTQSKEFLTGFRCNTANPERRGKSHVYTARLWFLTLHGEDKHNAGWAGCRIWKVPIKVTGKTPSAAEIRDIILGAFGPMLHRIGQAQDRAQQLRAKRLARRVPPIALTRAVLRTLRFDRAKTRPQWLASLAQSAGQAAVGTFVGQMAASGAHGEILRYLNAAREAGPLVTPSERLKDREFWLFQNWPRLVDEEATATQAFDQHMELVGYEKAGDLAAFQKWLGRLGIRLCEPRRPRNK
jgi:hypothetical protein